MKKLLTILALAVLLTGCTTTSPQTVNRVSSAAKLAAYIGATEYMRAYPVSRPAFELAQQELTRLSVAPSFDMADLLVIVNRLPVKNIKSERVQMYVTSSAILLQDFAGKLPVDRLAELKPLAGALADGLTLALTQ